MSRGPRAAPVARPRAPRPAVARRLLGALVALAAPCGGLPRVRLLLRSDGSMRLVAVDGDGGGCGAEIAPRGVSLAVKGPPWIPISDHFDREASVSQYDFEQLAAAGVNLIRLGAMMPGVLPRPPVDGVYGHDEGYVAQLRAFVERAASYGMYTLIEFHQDVISQHLCGEGLPRWASDEIRLAFDAEFEDEVIELLHRLTLDIPGLDSLEDGVFRQLIRKNVARTQFPMPVAEPYQVQSEGRFYAQRDCRKYEWYQYQLSFAAGHAYRRLFNLNSSTFRHVLTYWEILAEAFRGNPNVLAFDLFNEPHPGNFLTEPWIISPANSARRLSPFYSRIATRVHEIDPQRLVTFSPVTWEEGGYYLRAMNGPATQMCGWLRGTFGGMPLPGCETFWDVARWMPASGIETSAFTAAPLPGQSILSFHFYTPPELNHEAYARKRKSDAQRLQVYPLLSETCCLSDADALQRLYWFENAGIGWVMWEYKHMAKGRWMGKDWVDEYGAMITGTGPSMYHADGTPIKTHWRRLAHPSAQYVRGEVVANIFDFTVGTFNLTFIPSLDCGGSDGEQPDAVIMWPWTWWAYIDITSMPEKTISPIDAARVAELAQGPAGQDFNTPVIRFGVHALRRDVKITVTMTFVNFRNIDLVPEEVEPTVFGPWYQGLGWPLALFLFFAPQVLLTAWCCNWCCCSVGHHGGAPCDTGGGHGDVACGALAADLEDVSCLPAAGDASENEWEQAERCRRLFNWRESKTAPAHMQDEAAEHLLRAETPPEASTPPPEAGRGDSGAPPRQPDAHASEAPEPEPEEAAEPEVTGRERSLSRRSPRAGAGREEEEACKAPPRTRSLPAARSRPWGQSARGGETEPELHRAEQSARGGGPGQEREPARPSRGGAITETVDLDLLALEMDAEEDLQDPNARTGLDGL